METKVIRQMRYEDIERKIQEDSANQDRKEDHTFMKILTEKTSPAETALDTLNSDLRWN